MEIVEGHQTEIYAMDVLIGRNVCYQKHKPGKNLSVGRLPDDYFSIEAIVQLGSRLSINDGAIVMETAPTVMLREGRIAILLPTGEELYFLTQ